MIKKLIQIESRAINTQNIESYSLTRQFNQLKKN